MATIIICLLLAAAVFFAVRTVCRQVKNGECPGGCAGCTCHCDHKHSE
ncbi:MAG: FeoB-associated Cys-rich membrane protein [Agathobaculum sp.]|nr:FeoB-associated Cys-rich membrane protein [Agathobaculum sp.]MCI7125368.1 FeoB-associated Cys-rich membrane protein [Agathobaculum sp.]MDY3711690.1 FeoB-associated Cys-rich membrane protein [Agathobaculum sp.]